MKTVRYRTFKYPPRQASNVPLADFDFYIKSLIEVVHAWSMGSVRFEPETAKRLRTANRKLKEYLSAEAHPIVWEIRKSDVLWRCIGELVFNGHFSFVHCLTCEENFVFAECKVEDWSVGEWLVASGGRNLVCPHGHLLCYREEWNS